MFAFFRRFCGSAPQRARLALNGRKGRSSGDVSHCWRSQFESLEDRRLLAGNVLLEDDFNSENGGFAPHANYYAFANWNVTDGSVDLIDSASTAPGLPAANGLFVDLDGSTANAGRLESKTLFSLTQGDYLLSFELAGPRSSTNAFGGPNPSDTVDVSLGSLYSERITKAFSEPFERIERHVSVTAAADARLVFDHLGGDYVGLILDNVMLVRNQAPVAVDDTYSVNEDSSLVVPAAGTWATQPAITAMPTPRVFLAAGVLNEQLYVFGGGNTSGPTAALEAYDPLTNAWSSKASAPTAISSAAAGVIDNKLYVVGGCINADCRIGTTNLLQIYDPATNGWTTGAPMPTARHGMGAGVIDGKLYVAGGVPACPPCVPFFANLEVYDSLTNMWETKSPLPEARANSASAAIGGKLYVVGGTNGSQTLTSELAAYDPLTDTWDTTKAALPTAGNYPQAVAINERLYVIGGHNGVAGLTTNQVYDPNTDSWTTDTPLPDDLHAFAVGVINSQLYAVGGYRSCDTGCTVPNSLEIFTLGGVLANDSDPDGDDLSANLVTGPSNGTLDFNADGSFSYTPNANFNGTDSFTYQANDGIADSNIAMVTITVNAVNNGPTADAGGPYAFDEGVALTIDASASFDPDGDTLSYTWDVNGDGIFGDATGVSPTLTWAELNALGIIDNETPDGTPRAAPVKVRVDDDQGGQDEASTTLTVRNVAPLIVALESSSTGCGGAAEGQVVTISGSFTDAGTFDTHTSIIDWGDGATSAANISEANGSGSISGSHVYADGGVYTITISLLDDDGASDSAGTRAVIAGAGVHGGALEVVATDLADHVTVNMQDASTIKVHADFLGEAGGEKTFAATGVSKIAVLLCGGDDHAVVSSGVAIPATIDGGAGDDHLKGGDGHDVLLGGDGDDVLVGGGGRDLVIGGTGADRIIGNADDDILIAGALLFDDDTRDAAIEQVMAEWTSTRDYATRVNNLRDGSGSTDRLNGNIFLQDGVSVADDGARDVITGSSGLDWFLFNEEEDKATDLNDEEFADILDFVFAEP
jgi:N-acetylneuraminic acid mutarotase